MTIERSGRDGAHAPITPEAAPPPVRLGAGRLAPLDGIRAVAALAVVAYHLGFRLAGGGYVGVDWFFVLSAFLVGTLLLDQIDRTGDIDLGRFLRRRAVRLVPALLVMLLVMLAAITVFATDFASDAVREALPSAAYISNITLFGVSEQSSFFLHTWTLSLEMQFYLTLPFVLRWVRRRGWRDLWVACGALVAAFTVALVRCVLLDAFPRRWFVEDLPLLDTSRFAVGLALAFALRGQVPSWLTAILSRGWIACACAAIMLADLNAAPEVPGMWQPMHSVVIGVLVAVVIGHVVTRPDLPLARVLSLPPLTTIGLMSYSLYLWHFPIFTLLQDGFAITGHTAVRWGLKLVATAVATWASWRFVEGWSARRRTHAPVVRASTAKTV